MDDYFRRHAAANDVLGIGRAYVLRRAPDQDPSLPVVLGYYTLSMALVASADIAESLERKLPKYPLPVALIGRLAVDERARDRRLGELLLIDALRRRHRGRRDGRGGSVLRQVRLHDDPR
jgi:hypothetical protein